MCRCTCVCVCVCVFVYVSENEEEWQRRRKRQKTQTGQSGCYGQCRELKQQKSLACVTEAVEKTGHSLMQLSHQYNHRKCVSTSTHTADTLQFVTSRSWLITHVISFVATF